MQTQKCSLDNLISVKTSEGFVPPLGFTRRTLSVLNWINPADLEGIDSVFLFDDVPPTTPGKNRDLEEAVRDGLLLFAAYNRRVESWPAHIILIVRNLYKPVPLLLQHSPALTLWIAENLAHEVGHHLLAEKRFTLRPKTDGQGPENEEEFADRYAESIVAKMKSIPRYRFGSMLLKIAAQLDYFKGVRYWKKGKYQIAADYFYMATQLRRDHKDASYWFWKARERAGD